jgi:hypothetical protein
MVLTGLCPFVEAKRMQLFRPRHHPRAKACYYSATGQSGAIGGE